MAMGGCMKSARQPVTKDKRCSGCNGFCSEAAITPFSFPQSLHMIKTLPLHTREAGFPDSYDSDSANPKI